MLEEEAFKFLDSFSYYISTYALLFVSISYPTFWPLCDDRDCLA